MTAKYCAAWRGSLSCGKWGLITVICSLSFALLPVQKTLAYPTQADPVYGIKHQTTNTPPPLIPKPVSYQASSGQFNLTSTTVLYVEGETSQQTNELKRSAEYFNNKLKSLTGFSLKISTAKPATTNSIYFSVASSKKQHGSEEYWIDTTSQRINLTGVSPAAVFRGVQTLRQLLATNITENKPSYLQQWNIPCAKIHDYPTYSYRGTMLDVARHFFSVEEVERQIDNAAQFKINKFHIHLTDDQGWRIYIKSWPKLATVGGQNAVANCGPDGRQPCTKNFGYYTQDQLKDIIKYANNRYIEVIPEIDMPGHTNAALASYGKLNLDGKPVPPRSDIAVGYSSLVIRDPNNPNQLFPATKQFVTDVIGEIAAISPSPYIHIGGDEAQSTSPSDYDFFIKAVERIVSDNHKTLVGWSPNLVSGLVSKDALLQYWDYRGAVPQGANKLIMSTADYAYLDQKYDQNSKYGLNWAGYINTEKGYSWNPAARVSDPAKILGIEAPLFSETFYDTTGMDYLTYPRLPGYAEIGWTPASERNWSDYKKRLQAFGKIMTAEGIQYYRDPGVWPPTAN